MRRTQDEILQHLLANPEPYCKTAPTVQNQIRALEVISALSNIDDAFANLFGRLADEEPDRCPAVFQALTDVVVRITESQEKPELFVSHSPEEGIRVYSNIPEKIGDVLIFEAKDLKTPPTEQDLYTTTPEKLTGDVDTWQESLETGEVDLKTFCVNFIDTTLVSF